tara:strand:+ start:1037 stop:1174 length:138 start_codon:yes stop_codon:yes gene_type:complete
MTNEFKDMLLNYLRDMTQRGDHAAKNILDLIEEYDLLELSEEQSV